MNQFSRKIAEGFIVAGLVGLLGCDKKEFTPEEISNQIVVPSDPVFQEVNSKVRTIEADVDGDGSIDLVFGNQQSIDYFRCIGYYRSLKSHMWRLQQTIDIPSDLQVNDARGGFILRDVDGDRYLDLIIGTPRGSKVYRYDKGKFEEMKAEDVRE